nr:MAG TPA: hypothetical protein [Caudoviricetes sp.]
MTPEKTLEFAVRIIMVSRDDWVIPCKSMEEAQETASAIRNAIRWKERLLMFGSPVLAPTFTTEVSDVAVNPEHIESVYVIRMVGE